MILCRWRVNSARVTVELKVLGFFAGDYVNIITPVTVDDGAPVAELLSAARAARVLPKHLYSHLRRTRKSYGVMLNGETLSAGGRRKLRLRGGDSISFFSALSGG
jgi:hypothetical protein